MSDVNARLAELGVDLPEAAAPVANYVPFVRTGGLVHVAGQISRGPGGLIAGRLGEDLDLAGGQAAARICAVNLIAQFKAACEGDLNRVKRIVKLGGFVNAEPSFTQVPEVINGASDFLVQVFGENGRHARFAVGAAVLPLGAAVEIDAIIEAD